MRRADRDHARASLRHVAPRWPASSGRSRATRPTATPCCASSATTAAPPTTRRPSEYEGLTVTPVRHRRRRTARADLLAAAARGADRMLELGEQHGYRNAQVTVIAPTGTIGLVMDCDTTGIEPDFALVKFKKLAGGGYFKIINESVPPALAQPRLHAAADRGHRPLLRRRRHARGLPAHQPRAACGQRASPTTSIARDRGAAAARVRPAVRLQPLDARRRGLHRAPRHRPGASSTSPASTCSRRSASPTSRSTRPTPTSAAR